MRQLKDWLASAPSGDRVEHALLIAAELIEASDAHEKMIAELDGGSPVPMETQDAAAIRWVSARDEWRTFLASIGADSSED